MTDRHRNIAARSSTRSTRRWCSSCATRRPCLACCGRLTSEFLLCQLERAIWIPSSGTGLPQPTSSADDTSPIQVRQPRAAGRVRAHLRRRLLRRRPKGSLPCARRECRPDGRDGVFPSLFPPAVSASPHILLVGQARSLVGLFNPIGPTRGMAGQTRAWTKRSDWQRRTSTKRTTSHSAASATARPPTASPRR